MPGYFVRCAEACGLAGLGRRTGQQLVLPYRVAESPLVVYGPTHISLGFASRLYVVGDNHSYIYAVASNMAKKVSSLRALGRYQKGCREAEARQHQAPNLEWCRSLVLSTPPFAPHF